MKAIVCALAVVSAAILIEGGQSLSAEYSRPEGVSAQQYCEIIDSVIASCQKKGELRESGSPNVRKDAVVSLMKADFYKKNKDKLAAGMVEESVAPKHYSVRHYLNLRFYSFLRKCEPQAAQVHGDPDEVALPTPQD